MAKWTVTVTYQSVLENESGKRVNPPVIQVWMREGSEVSALATAAQLLEDEVSPDFPDRLRTEVLNIKIERV